MGKIGDWIEIFENLEYFLYSALVREGEETPIGGCGYLKAEDNGEIARKIAAQTAMRDKNCIRMGDIFFDRYMEKTEPPFYKTRENFSDGIYYYDEGIRDGKIPESLKPFVQGERNIGEDEAFYGMNEILEEMTERIMDFQNSEDSVCEVAFYPKMTEEILNWKEESEKSPYERLIMGKRGKPVREKIIEGSYKKAENGNKNIKLEMHNVNNVTSDVDIDRVTDMLTDRLYEMMQRSAEGIYM